VVVAFLFGRNEQFTSQPAILHNWFIWFSTSLAISIRDENLKATIGGRQVDCGTEATTRNIHDLPVAAIKSLLVVGLYRVCRPQ
jgi:hypothetical protein